MYNYNTYFSLFDNMNTSKHKIVPKEVVTNTVKEFFGEKNKKNKDIFDAVTHEL